MTAPHRRGHYGAWRALCALPTVCGSVLVLSVVFGWLDRWFVLVLLGWAVVAATVWFGPGERFGVRISYRYRTPTAAQRAVLFPVVQRAVRGCAVPATAIDLYVRLGDQAVNGFAAGRRSVAFSQGAVDAVAAGRLSTGQAVALLTHELGHHLTGGSRYALVLDWLSLPWRLAAGVVYRMLRLIVRRVPTARAALVLVPVVAVVAVVQAVQYHAWSALVVFAGLLLVVLQPSLDAAASRASERAADRFTVDCGSGSDLADVLLEHPSRRRAGRWDSSHPDPARRVADLTGAVRR